MPELDLGNVKGPQGKSAYQSALDAGYSGSEEAFNKAMAKAPDAVLYTPQSLTDTQQTQARGNINAAPGGFGLGTRSKWLTDADDLNNIYQGGFYFWYGDKKPANSPKDIYYGGMIVMSRSPTEFVQQVFTITDTSILQNCMLVRTAYNNTWYPWEWVNPPMLLGTEYRTTERYLGKPVYVKTFNIPTSVFTNQGADYAHGIANLDRIVDSFVCCRADYIRIFPWSYYASAEWSAQYMLNSSVIKFEIGSNALARIKEYTNGVDVTLKYTKTTD